MRFALPLLLVLLGCEGATPIDASMDPTIDGSVDGGVDGTPINGEVAAPAPPTPPDFSNCPEGWRRTNIAGVPACHPWPSDSGPETCPPGFAHFIGTAGCERIGSPCPEGDFAEDIESTGQVWYVQPGATGGGTRESPFPTFARARTLLRPGDTVALSKGRHVGPINLPNGISLVGACTEETVVVGEPREFERSTILAVSGPVEVRELRVESTGFGIAGEEVDVRLNAVEVSTSVGLGLFTYGGTITGERLVIRETLTDGTSGNGMAAEGGGTIDLRWVSIEGSDINPLAVFDESLIRLTDAVMRRDPESGPGAITGAEGNLDLTRIAVHDSYLHAMIVRGTTLNATDLFVEGTRPDAMGLGSGITAFGGAKVTLSRVVLMEPPHLGFTALDEGTELSVSDVIVNGVSRSPEAGVAVQATKSASINVERAVLADTHGAAVLVFGGTGSLRDVDIQRVGEASVSPGTGISSDDGIVSLDRVRVTDSPSGMAASRSELQITDLTLEDCSLDAIGFEAGTTAAVERMAVHNTAGLSIFVAHEGTRVDFTDLAVVGGGGRGLQVGQGAQVTVTRAHIEDITNIAMSAFGEGTRLSVENVTIERLRSSPDTGEFGFGVYAAESGRVEGDQVRVHQARGYGLLSVLSGTVDMTNVRVENTLPIACGECPSQGVGVGAIGGGNMILRSFHIGNNELCGAQVVDNSTLDIQSGEIVGNPIGLNVQRSDFDFDPDQAAVQFSDNGRTIDSSGLPVPDISELTFEP